MPIAPIHRLGTRGIIKDIPPHELPPEAWSDGQNVRFTDEKVAKIDGHTPVFGTPIIPPYWALAVPTATQRYWLYANMAKVAVHDGASHLDITRAVGGDYSATGIDLWTGTILGGIPVLNNGVDVPQFWGPQQVSQKLQDLTAWPATLRAKVIREFKGHLFALNVIKSGVSFPHMVKWSHSADPGTLPDSWDESDPTKDAGEREIGDTQSGLVREGLRLGDLFIVYKDYSTWAFQLIGGRFIFRSYSISDTSGILGTHCVVPVDRGPFGNMRQHAVLTADDFIVHNGQTLQGLLTKRMRKFLANELSATNFNRSYVVNNRARNEIWACFPSKGETWPTLALVWGYTDNTLGVRELQRFPFIASGNIRELVDGPWDSDSEAWDADVSIWDVEAFSPGALDLLICSAMDTKFYTADSSNQFAGVNMTSFIERRGLGVVGQDREGNPKVDVTKRKLGKRIWPKAQGGPFRVRMGSQQTDNENEPVDWVEVTTNSGTDIFTPGIDTYADFEAEGRYLAARFESADDVGWEIDSYSLEVEVLGEM